MDINDVMEINKENKLFIEEMLASYNHSIKKYIIFDNSTVKINMDDIHHLLIYPADAKSGIAEEIRDKTTKYFVTQTADIVVDANSNRDINIMYVRSGLDRITRDKEVLKLISDLSSAHWI